LNGIFFYICMWKFKGAHARLSNRARLIDESGAPDCRIGHGELVNWVWPIERLGLADFKMGTLDKATGLGRLGN